MTEILSTVDRDSKHVPWNKGKIVDAKLGQSGHALPVP